MSGAYCASTAAIATIAVVAGAIGGCLLRIDESRIANDATPTTAEDAGEDAPVCSACADAGMTTVAFQQGVFPTAAYAGATDTTLRQAASLQTGGSDLEVQADSDQPEGSLKAVIGLMRFDLTAIPPASRVIAVTLSVAVTNRTTGTGYSLYQLSRSWSELEATWNVAATGQPWSLGGARGSPDRQNIELAHMAPLVEGNADVAMTAAGVAAVQAWVSDPSNNFGYVIDTIKNADGLSFASAKATALADRPVLRVTFVSNEPNGAGGDGG